MQRRILLAALAPRPRALPLQRTLFRGGAPRVPTLRRALGTAPKASLKAPPTFTATHPCSQPRITFDRNVAQLLDVAPQKHPVTTDARIQLVRSKYPEVRRLQAAIQRNQAAVAFKLWRQIMAAPESCAGGPTVEDATAYLGVIGSGVRAMRYETKLAHMRNVLDWISRKRGDQGLTFEHVRPVLMALSHMRWASAGSQADALLARVDPRYGPLPLEALVLRAAVLVRSRSWGRFTLEHDSLREPLKTAEDRAWQARAYAKLLDAVLAGATQLPAAERGPAADIVNTLLDDMAAAQIAVDEALHSVLVKTLALLYDDAAAAETLLAKRPQQTDRGLLAVLRGLSQRQEWAQMIAVEKRFADKAPLRGDTHALLLAAYAAQVTAGVPGVSLRGFWQRVAAAAAADGGVLYPAGSAAVRAVFYRGFPAATVAAVAQVTRMALPPGSPRTELFQRSLLLALRAVPARNVKSPAAETERTAVLRDTFRDLGLFWGAGADGDPGPVSLPGSGPAT